MKKYLLYLFTLFAAVLGCNKGNTDFEASGTFEAEEVVVSAEVGGRILSFNIEEGQTLSAGSMVGQIDAENISLQKQQIEERIRALREKTADVTPQIELLQDQLAVQQAELKRLLRERARTENLLKQDAATGKQLDDINAQIEVLEKQIQVTRQQIQVQRSNISTQNRGILSEEKPLEKQAEQLGDQLKRANITNPVTGTVLAKYAQAGEVTAPGKALYKIADLSVLTLRAYVSGSQLPQIKLNQQVKVLVDKDEDEYKTLSGTVTWISDKAEFTPKTIQTKEERANQVYAVKIRVKNDGYLKIGMYGEVVLSAR